VLRAQNIGFATGYVPIVMIAMNVVYAAAAYPAGAVADRMRRQALLLAELGTLIAADIVLAAATTAWHVLVGAMLWGLHMAVTQALMSKLIAPCRASTPRSRHAPIRRSAAPRAAQTPVALAAAHSASRVGRYKRRWPAAMRLREAAR
jgi:MFS family permease